MYFSLRQNNYAKVSLKWMPTILQLNPNPIPSLLSPIILERPHGNNMFWLWREWYDMDFHWPSPAFSTTRCWCITPLSRICRLELTQTIPHFSSSSSMSLLKQRDNAVPSSSSLKLLDLIFLWDVETLCCFLWRDNSELSTSLLSSSGLCCLRIWPQAPRWKSLREAWLFPPSSPLMDNPVISPRYLIHP